MVARAKRRKRRKARITRIGTIGKDSEGRDVPLHWSFDCQRAVPDFDVLEHEDGTAEVLIAGYTVAELKKIAEAEHGERGR